MKFARVIYEPNVSIFELKTFLDLHLSTLNRKKVWKKVELIVQSSGLYHRPAGKGKYELTCLEKIADVCVYISLGWRKKYKAPSECGIALKVSDGSSLIIIFTFFLPENCLNVGTRIH